MLYRTLTLLSFFFCFSLSIISQNQVESFNDVISKYNTYHQLEPETFYTQTNKKIYFEGESIWFKTYVYNTRNLKPYIATKNIHVTLHDNDGKQITKKILYAEDATTFGHFKITKDLKPGRYFIKTTSTWMKNFNEDRSFVNTIEILKSDNKKQTQENGSIKYDIKILPEGGYAIANTNNTFGFKITNSIGNGEKILNGEIKAGDKVITSFRNNILGIGKFKFFTKPNTNYSAHFTLDTGEVISKPIDNIKPQGISISAENVFNKDYLFITLSTNATTLPSLEDKTFYLAFNKDGLLKETEVIFTPKKLEYLIKFKKSHLAPGVNTLTLFNEEGKPLLERLLFNPNGIKIGKLTSAHASVLKGKDSTHIHLDALENLLGKTGSLSISVLPSKTKANKTNNSILSTFLLKPYLKGKIENPKFYFDTLNRKSLYNLDLLLITQGWSRYSWNNIFYKPQLPIKEFEIGFTLKGKLNNHKYNPKENLIFFSKKNGLRLETKLFEDSSFKLDNLFIADSSDIQFSLKKNKETRPNVYYTLSPIFKEELLKVDSKNTVPKSTRAPINFNLVYKNIFVLDTVNLSAQSKKPKPKNRLLQGSFGSKYISFEDNNRYSPGTLVTDVIMDNGFDVYNYGLDVRITSRRAITFSSGAISPAIFIDNVQHTDLQILATMRISEIEEMSISQRGNLLGSAGAAGVIQIFTKTSFKNKRLSKFNSHISNTGFSQQIEYYNPKYDQVNNETYQYYGVIHWNPMVKATESGDINFAIPNTTIKNINLYIEGMAEDGTLFSKIETLQIK